MAGLVKKGSFWLAVLLVALYGFRATQGLVCGLAFSKGKVLAAEGYYAQALPLLERGAVGENRYEALWLAAEVRQGLWELLAQEEKSKEEGIGLLRKAATGYLQALALSPASGWPWIGLGDVLGRVEKAQRAGRSYDIAALAADRWTLVGRPGRISIGMLRLAIEKEKNVFHYRDQLVLRLVEYGLDETAGAAVRDAARVHPDIGMHSTLELNGLSRPLLEQFAETSAQTLDDAPLLRRERHLVSLGKLYRRLGKLDEAESYLRQAVEEPASKLHRAEGAYNLALVLVDREKYEEAEAFLDIATGHRGFRAAVLAEKARIAMRREKPEEALKNLQQCRTLDPRNLGFCLRYATVARRLEQWDKAEEALRWALIVHPRNLVPRLELAKTYLERGNIVAAEREIKKARVMAGDAPEILELEARIAAISQGFL